MTDRTASTPPVRNANEAHQEQLSGLDRLALWITNRVGTMGFFFVIFGWTLIWLAWNMVAPKHMQFDPPTAFVFWLFISNLVQIFLMPLIMVGQNVQAKFDKIVEDSRFELIRHEAARLDRVDEELARQTRLLERIAEKAGVDVADHPESNS